MTKHHLKQKLELTIRCVIPSLNEYINMDRSNRFNGARMKRNATQDVMWEIKAQLPKSFETIVSVAYIAFEWHCINRKKDPDNISGMGRKVILDSLQEAGVLKQDNWNAILGFEDSFDLDNKDPRCVVRINY